jgi:hypothetical protein
MSPKSRSENVMAFCREQLFTLKMSIHDCTTGTPYSYMQHKSGKEEEGMNAHVLENVSHE